MYQHVQAYAGDPILSLVETFKQDPRHNKINLSIGIYFDNDGKMPLPESVRIASEQVGLGAQGYLPMEGHAGFRQAAAQLILGVNSSALNENRVAVVQTLGGSGALKLGADFLHHWFGGVTAHISDPTWDNHRGIFEGAGFAVRTYPYYDSATIDVKFDAMCDYFRALPKHDIVLLHPCCHNPTGVDLSSEQWDTLLQIVAERELIAFMDIAYLGFGDTFERDAYAVRRAVELGIALLVSGSTRGRIARSCADYHRSPFGIGTIEIWCAPSVFQSACARRIDRISRVIFARIIDAMAKRSVRNA